MTKFDGAKRQFISTYSKYHIWWVCTFKNLTEDERVECSVYHTWDEHLQPLSFSDIYSTWASAVELWQHQFNLVYFRASILYTQEGEQLHYRMLISWTCNQLLFAYSKWMLERLQHFLKRYNRSCMHVTCAVVIGWWSSCGQTSYICFHPRKMSCFFAMVFVHPSFSGTLTYCASPWQNCYENFLNTPVLLLWFQNTTYDIIR